MEITWGGATLSRFGRRCLSAAELFCLGMTIFHMSRSGHNRIDFLCIILFAVMIGIVMSGTSSIHPYISSRSSKCADLSIALYMCHLMIGTFVTNVLMPSATYFERLPVYLVLSGICAVLLMLVVNGIRRLRIPERIKMSS